MLLTSEADLEQLAYHEAGHVGGWRQFEETRTLFLERGYVLVNALAGYGQTGLGSANVWVRRQPPPVEHATIVIAMAGRAAEAIQYPLWDRAQLVRSSAHSDERLARHYISVLYGSDLSEAEVVDRIEQAEAEALELIRNAWAGIQAVAKTLLARVKTEMAVELTGSEALAVMDTALGLATTVVISARW
jgi:hypothetical protein